MGKKAKQQQPEYETSALRQACQYKEILALGRSQRQALPYGGATYKFREGKLLLPLKAACAAIPSGRSFKVGNTKYFC
jgi:hypothetical protein